MQLSFGISWCFSNQNFLCTKNLVKFYVDRFPVYVAERLSCWFCIFLRLKDGFASHPVPTSR